MTNLNDILNVAILEELIKDGYISRKMHNDYPLAVLNYTPQAQYDPNLVWNTEMNLSRGLVYNIDTLQVIARPFAKFWNFSDSRHIETMPENLPNEIPLVLDKLDGSLGILFEWDGKNHVATRGSFHSEQAEWATKWLRSNHPGLILPLNYTLVTEIIYHENKIVIDYDFEGLVLLSIVGIFTGKEQSRGEIENYSRATGFDLVKEYDKSLSEMLAENEKNREGYVLTYPSTGLKIKVKFDEYVRLHKILTGLNVRSVWELLRDNQSSVIDGWCKDDHMPQSFKNWVFNVAGELCAEYADINNSVQTIFANKPQLDPFMPYKDSRKMMAEYFTKEENRKYSGLLFSLLDGKNIEQSIWRMIEPSGTKIYRADGE
jgi:RNA ligase